MDRMALALGGGAAKGLAHVGVLMGIEEDGFEIEAVAGTSMGSIIAALAAQGVSAKDMAALLAAVDWVRLGRILVTSVSGAAYFDMLRETFGGTLIEELGIPFAAVCCDVDTGEGVALTSGDLAEAVSASSALPGILPARRIGDRRLVDGAVVEPVPIATVSEMATGTVIGVNVLRPPGRRDRVAAIVTTVPIVVKLPTIFRRLEGWMRRRSAGRFAGDVDARLSRWETLVRSLHILEHRLATLAGRTAPMIEPPLGTFGWFDFHRADEIVEVGYQAYRAWRQEQDG